MDLRIEPIGELRHETDSESADEHESQRPPVAHYAGPRDSQIAHGDNQQEEPYATTEHAQIGKHREVAAVRAPRRLVDLLLAGHLVLIVKKMATEVMIADTEQRMIPEDRNRYS